MIYALASLHTVLYLINALGALQFTSPRHGILGTKTGHLFISVQ